MSKVEIVPYLLPEETRMKPKLWILDMNSELILIQESYYFLKDWDPGLSFTAYIDFDCDVSGIFQDCCLSNSSKLLLGTSWYSSGTNLSGIGQTVELDSSTDMLIDRLTLLVPGEQVSKNIKLTLSIVLLENTNPKSLSPSLPGTILWQDLCEIQLPDGDGRFPTDLIDFSSTSSLVSYGNAAWFLDWDQDNLHQIVDKDIRLYMNSHNDRVKKAVSGQDGSEKAIIDTIRYEIGKTWILSALNNKDFITDPYQYPPGSVGWVVYRLIELLFAPNNAKDLRALSQDASRFELLLQEKLSIFGGRE